MKQVYLLTGPNEVSLRDFTDDLCKDIPKDNIQTYYADDTEPGIIFSECAQSSLFGNRTVIVVRKIGALTKKNEFQEKLLNYLESPNPDNTLILEWEKPGAKVVAKINGYKHFEKHEFKKLYDNDLMRYARNKFIEAQIKFEESVLDYLLMLTNKEIEDLAMNCRMLIDYAGEGKELTLEQAKQVLSRSHNLSVFDFLDALFLGKKATALSALQDFKLSSDHHILGLLALMMKEAVMIWTYLTRKGKTNNIAQELGISSFRLKKVIEKANHVNLKFISAVFELIESIEIKSKSMSEDFAYMELENFILRQP